jgi:hypothetical protein
VGRYLNPEHDMFLLNSFSIAAPYYLYIGHPSNINKLNHPANVASV